jgi:hypothetical protein
VPAGEPGSAVAFFTEGFCLGEPGLAGQMARAALALETGVRCVTGHFLFGFDVPIPRSCVYLTLLRDPVERILSLYQHFLRWGDDAHGVRRRGLTLRQFVREGSCPELDNGQTRRVAGLPAAGLSGEALLAAAISRLADGSVLAGLTEQHAASVRRFAGLFGWRAGRAPAALVNPQRPRTGEVPPGVLREIAERNRLDAALLRYARSAFAAGAPTGSPALGAPAPAAPAVGVPRVSPARPPTRPPPPAAR